jgi:flagellin
MAREVVQMSKNNLLMQASQAMLANANQMPEGMLKLLK